MFNRDEAAEIFLKDFVREGYGSGVKVTLTYLNKGVKAIFDEHWQRVQHLHEWFQNLNPEDQAKVQEVVRETAGTVLFRICCLLDGVAGMALEDYYSDFAVYLQIYSEWEDLLQNQPAFSVRINPNACAPKGEDLHDLIEVFIDEYERSLEEPKREDSSEHS